MSEKKKKKKLSTAGLIIIIGISIIAIPCIVFAGILGIAALQNGSPRNGSRFDGDFVYEITEQDISNIESDLGVLSNVDEFSVILSEGQLKIMIDVKDSLSQEECEKLVNDAFTKVSSRLPVDRYFTSSLANRNYDLAINVYTTIEASEINATNPRIYYQLHKNGAGEFKIELLSQPRVPEQAAELRNEQLEDQEDDGE